MKLKSLFITLGLSAMLAGCGGAETSEGVAVREEGGAWHVYIDGRPMYINGVGGTNRLDVASANGANAFRTWGGSVESIQKDLELARANGIKVVLTSVLPAASFGWNKTITDAPQKIAALNKRIAAYADEQGLPYVDYYHALLADDGHSLDAAYSKDGVHPTLDGYRVMEPLVKKVVAEVLGNGSGK